jgi:hypothetical protein
MVAFLKTKWPLGQDGPPKEFQRGYWVFVALAEKSGEQLLQGLRYIIQTQPKISQVFATIPMLQKHIHDQHNP